MQEYATKKLNKLQKTETAPQAGQKILRPEARAQPTEGATSKTQHFHNQKDAKEKKNIQKEQS